MNRGACIVAEITKEAAASTIPVVLHGGEEASGLADMLRQFLEQTIAESPRKARLARRLSGHAVFRSAEDQDLCVRITFGGDRIELQDAATPCASDPIVTADFLTIAHLTSGQESPLRLFVQRKLRARFPVGQIPFLVGMLRFLRIEPAGQSASWRRWVAPAALTALAAGTLCWYATAR